MAIGFFFTDTITVQQQMAGQDSSGGPTKTYTTRYANVPCMIEDTRAYDKFQFMQLQMDVTHTVYTFQSGIQNGDRVVDNATGLIFRVTGFIHRRAKGSIPEHYEILCLEARN